VTENGPCLVKLESGHLSSSGIPKLVRREEESISIKVQELSLLVQLPLMVNILQQLTSPTTTMSKFGTHTMAKSFLEIKEVLIPFSMSASQEKKETHQMRTQLVKNILAIGILINRERKKVFLVAILDAVLHA